MKNFIRSLFYSFLIIGTVSPSLLGTEDLSGQSILGQTLPPPIKLQADGFKGVFQNYYAFLDPTSRTARVEQACASALRRTQVPYVGADGQGIVFDGFFRQLNQYVQSLAPGLTSGQGVRTYVSGGMVRNLLGYTYAKIRKAHKKALIATGGQHLDDLQMQALATQTLDRIIQGKSRKNAGAVKILKPMDTLGVNSDFDVLLDFPADFEEWQSMEILEKTTKFINSATLHLGLASDRSELKNCFLPKGDVEIYHKKYGMNPPGRAPTSGGSAFDWLAFLLDDDSSGARIRMPDTLGHILEDYFKGKLHFYYPAGKTEIADTQVVRAFRALQDNPFLVYNEVSEHIIAKELEGIVKKKELSSEARLQFPKMQKNGRDGGVDNGMAIPGLHKPNYRINRLMRDLTNILEGFELRTKPLIPEFLEETLVALRLPLPRELFLISLEDYIANHTMQGQVFHGTREIANYGCMLRNGLIVSSMRQGLAACKKGFYTAKNQHTAQIYSGGGNGIVIPLQIRQHPNLRILDINTESGHAFYEAVKKAHPDEDSNEIIARDYHVDIIVPKDHGYSLFLNVDALILPKDIKGLLQAQVVSTIQAIQESMSFYSHFVDTWKQHVHPSLGYSLFLQALGQKPTREGIEVLRDHVRKSINQKEYVNTQLHAAGWVIVDTDTSPHPLFSKDSDEYKGAVGTLKNSLTIHREFFGKFYDLYFKDGQFDDFTFPKFVEAFKDVPVGRVCDIIDALQIFKSKKGISLYIESHELNDLIQVLLATKDCRYLASSMSKLNDAGFIEMNWKPETLQTALGQIQLLPGKDVPDLLIRLKPKEPVPHFFGRIVELFKGLKNPDKVINALNTFLDATDLMEGRYASVQMDGRGSVLKDLLKELDEIADPVSAVQTVLCLLTNKDWKLQHSLGDLSSWLRTVWKAKDPQAVVDATTKILKGQDIPESEASYTVLSLAKELCLCKDLPVVALCMGRLRETKLLVIGAGWENARVVEGLRGLANPKEMVDALECLSPHLSGMNYHDLGDYLTLFSKQENPKAFAQKSCRFLTALGDNFKGEVENSARFFITKLVEDPTLEESIFPQLKAFVDNLKVIMPTKHYLCWWFTTYATHRNNAQGLGHLTTLFKSIDEHNLWTDFVEVKTRYSLELIQDCFAKYLLGNEELLKKYMASEKPLEKSSLESLIEKDLIPNLPKW